MTETLIQPMNTASIVETLLYWTVQLAITLTLVVTCIRDMVAARRTRTRYLWIQSLTLRKQRRVRALSFAGLAVGTLPLAASLITRIALDWTESGRREQSISYLDGLRYDLPIAAVGLIPFLLGQVLVLIYRRHTHTANIDSVQ